MQDRGGSLFPQAKRAPQGAPKETSPELSFGCLATAKQHGLFSPCRISVTLLTFYCAHRNALCEVFLEYQEYHDNRN